jgi:hypothetical protein
MKKTSWFCTTILITSYLFIGCYSSKKSYIDNSEILFEAHNNDHISKWNLQIVDANIFRAKADSNLLFRIKNSEPQLENEKQLFIFNNGIDNYIYVFPINEPIITKEGKIYTSNNNIGSLEVRILNDQHYCHPTEVKLTQLPASTIYKGCGTYRN